MNRTLGAITVAGARCCIPQFEVMSATVDCARTGLRGYCHALICGLWHCACGAPQIIWWSASARKCVPRSGAIDLRAAAIPASPRCMPHACARRSRRTADPVDNAPGVVRAIASCMISRPITRTKSVSTASHAGRRIPRVSHAGTALCRSSAYAGIMAGRPHGPRCALRPFPRARRPPQRGSTSSARTTRAMPFSSRVAGGRLRASSTRSTGGRASNDRPTQHRLLAL